jgi:hypothetical protein
MAKFSAKCPECGGKFPWEPTKGYPKACPLCGFDTSIDEDATAIVLPAFLSAASKANDKLYRDMEKGSEFRAQAAAEMAGVPVSEMSGLKITNLNDRRDAEIAAKDTEARMAAARLGLPSIEAPFQQNGASFSGAVQTGAFANSGAKFQTVLREKHAEATGYRAVGDLPALEVMNPGYRRRG